MSKVTSKLQVKIPKALAKLFGISPGDEIEWQAAGEAIRITPVRPARSEPDVAARVSFFDRATKRRDQPQGRVTASA